MFSKIMQLLLAILLFGNTLLFAQAKAVLVWDEAKLSLKNQEPASPKTLVEGMKLDVGTEIKVDKGHEVTLIAENGRRTVLIGPTSYVVPELSWKEVGYLLIIKAEKEEKIPLFGDYIVPVGSTIHINEGYDLFIQNKWGTKRKYSGPMEYNVEDKGLKVVGYRIGSDPISTSDYTYAEDLTKLGINVKTLRGDKDHPKPLLPRGTIRENKQTTFSWTSDRPGTIYVLKVWNEQNEVVLKAITSQTSFVTENPKVVTARKYIWTVGVIDETQENDAQEIKLKRDQHKITVRILPIGDRLKLTPMEQEALRQKEKSPENVSSWWNLLMLYYNYHLYMDVMHIFKDIIERFGDKPHKIFPLLYKICVEKMGISDPEIIQKSFGYDILKIAYQCRNKPSIDQQMLEEIIKKLEGKR